MSSTARVLLPLSSRSPLFLFVAALASLAAGCASGSPGFAFDDTDAATEDGGSITLPASDDATLAPVIREDDGATIIGALSVDASPSIEDSPPIADAPPSPPFDAGDAGLCTGPLAGDLAIVELLIESTSGAGDHGEWIEVASTLACAIDLKGLHGECPTGAKVNTFDVTDDLWIPPMGSFVVADSSDPAVNHALPGVVLAWSGKAGDVLRNAGATVTLLFGNAIIDSVTYPSMKLVAGVSTSFPSDCDRNLRPAWTSWQSSTASWFPAFRGTPNAPNVDVHCPTAPDD